MAKTITRADIVEYLHTQLGLNKSDLAIMALFLMK